MYGKIQIAYLLDDVLPSAGGLQTDQLIVQSLTHGLDARAHDLQVLVPVGSKLLAGKNLLDDAAANTRAHGELAADQVA